MSRLEIIEKYDKKLLDKIKKKNIKNNIETMKKILNIEKK